MDLTQGFENSTQESQSGNLAFTRARLMMRARALASAQEERKAKLQELMSYTEAALAKSGAAVSPSFGNAEAGAQISLSANSQEFTSDSLSSLFAKNTPASSILSRMPQLSSIRATSVLQPATSLEEDAEQFAALSLSPRGPRLREDSSNTEQGSQSPAAGSVSEMFSTAPSAMRPKSAPRDRPASAKAPPVPTPDMFQTARKAMRDKAVRDKFYKAQSAAAADPPTAKTTSGRSQPAATGSAVGRKVKDAKSALKNSVQDVQERQRRSATYHKWRADVTTRLEQSKHQATKLQENLKNLEEREEAIAKERSSFAESSKLAARDLQARINELQVTTHSVQDEARFLKDRLRLEREQFAPALEILQTKKQRADGEFEQKLVAVRQQRESVNTRKAARSRDISALEERLGKLRVAVNTRKEEMSSIKESMEQMRKKEQDIERLIAQQKVEYDRLKDEDSSVQVQIARLKDEETSLLTKLDQLKGQYGLEIDMAGREVQHRKACAEFQKVKEQQTSRINGMQTEIDSLRKELTTRSAENDAMIAAFQSKKEAEEVRMRKNEEMDEKLATYAGLKEQEIAKAVLFLRELQEKINDPSLRVQDQVLQKQLVLIEEEERAFLAQWNEQNDQMLAQRRQAQEDIAAAEEKLAALEAEIERQIQSRLSGTTDGTAEETHLAERLKKCLAEKDIRSARVRMLQGTLERQRQRQQQGPEVLAESKARLAQHHANLQVRINELQQLQEEKARLLQQKVPTDGEERQALGQAVGAINDKIGRIGSEIDEIQRILTVAAAELNADPAEVEKELKQESGVVAQLDEQIAKDMAAMQSVRSGSADVGQLRQEVEASRAYVEGKRQLMLQLEERIGRHVVEKNLKLHVLHQWKTLANERSIEASERDAILREQTAYIQEERKALAKIKEAQQQKSVQHAAEREEWTRKVEAERQRVVAFSEFVGVIESQMRAIAEKKRAVETEWNAMCETEYRRVKSFQAQRALDDEAARVRRDAFLREFVAATGPSGATPDQMAQAERTFDVQMNERLQFLKRVFGRVDAIREEVAAKLSLLTEEQADAQKAAMLDRQQKKLAEMKSSMDKSKSQLRETVEARTRLEARMASIPREIEQAAREATVAERQLEELAAGDPELSRDEKRVEMMEKVITEEHRKSFEALLAEIEFEKGRAVQHTENVCKPIKAEIDDKTRLSKEAERRLLEMRRELEESKTIAEQRLQDLDTKLQSIKSQRASLQNRIASKQQSVEQLSKELQRGDMEHHQMLVSEHTVQVLKHRHLLTRVVHKVNDLEREALDQMQLQQQQQQQQADQAEASGSDEYGDAPLQDEGQQEPPLGIQLSADGGGILLFGPGTAPLTLGEFELVRSRVLFMLRGTLLSKRNVGRGPAETIVRHVCLSQEFTRLEVRDKSKKVPESFIKIEHVLSIAKMKRPGASAPLPGSPSTDQQATGQHGLVIHTKDKKLEFNAFSEEECKNWVEGIEILVKFKNQLFYLRYNMKQFLAPSAP